MRSGVLERVRRIASQTVAILGEVAAWSGLVMVLIVAGNVLGNAFFGVSSVAMQEMEWHLMAVGALFGMAYGLNQGGEVRVDIFFDKMSSRAQASIDALSRIALVLVALVIFWLCVPYMLSSYRIGEGSPDPGGLEHRWILKAMMPAAFLLLAIQALAMTIESLLTLFSAEKKG